MANLGSLLTPFKKLGGVGAQLFTWQVAGQFVSTLMTPFFRATEQDANARDPNAVLSPAELAAMVVRGHISYDEATKEAAKSGISSGRFGAMVENYGSPLGPLQLAEALRRGFIQEGQVGSDAPTFLGGISQGDLQNKWAAVLKDLETHDPSAETAVEGLIKGQLGPIEAAVMFAKLGGNPQYFQTIYNNLGRPPSPLEAAVMAHRGVIPWTGKGQGVLSFEQAVAESDYRTKWTDAYRRLSDYLPPPRTITAMFREGSISEATARDLLLKHGLPDELVSAYLTKKTATAVQKAHEVTESEILRLYVQHALSKEQVVQVLKDHNYSETDIPYILQAAELQQHTQEVNAGIAVVKGLFTNGKIDYNTAVTELDLVGTIPEHRDYLLKLWGFERGAGAKHLTAAQVQAAAADELLTGEEAVRRLVLLGYDTPDATLLIEIKLGPQSDWHQGQQPPVTTTPPNAIAPSQPAG